MQIATLKAKPRTRGRKSELKQIRAAGQIPAILYGSGDAARLLRVEAHALQPVLRQSHGTTLLIDLDLEDEKQPIKSVIREVQRHPVSREILHCDLLKVDMSRTYEVTVPVVLEGEPVGVKTFGGIMTVHLREVEIRCLPGSIPESYGMDVSGLQIGDSIRVEQIPRHGDEEFLTHDDVSVVSVAAPRVEEVPVAAAEEAEEVVEAEEEAGKPEEAEKREKGKAGES